MSSQPRKSNFELLRIIAMFMVVSSHYSYYGIMRTGETDSFLWQTGTLVHKIVACFLMQGELGVALYFMISGYFLISKDKVSVLHIAIKTILYSFALGLLLLLPYIILCNEGGGNNSMVKNVIKVFFLPLSTEYWFITCYLLLCVLLPVLNPLLRKLNLKTYVLFLFAVFCFWYLLATFLNNQYANLMRSFLFWCLGCFFGIFFKDIKIKPFSIFCLFVASFMGIIASTSGYYFTYCGISSVYKAAGFMLVKSGVFLSAVSLFLIFKSLEIGTVKSINVLSLCTFGVYLIHEHPFARPLIWYKVIDVLHRQYFSKYFLSYAFITVFAVFLLCAFLDLLFRKTFEERICSKLSSYLEKRK